jgi:hypothetical protein
MAQRLDAHTYRLQLTEDGQGEARSIEFDAFGSEIALDMAFKFCGSRPATLFEDGRKLADIQHAKGFWHIR